ncbi:DUF6968 family protein [Ostreibacterium oceani]|uniref:DUF6968 domain-containing protein n=1 Tax=Ostreibacterium oceani TaxID=2654998 RepID=A0A6N7ER15_9GAMM|nr:hypothetical protein [Ostreibacterium oceani]MPV85304.1 hypothetical protein [Ostreibacterium oceani]
MSINQPIASRQLLTEDGNVITVTIGQPEIVADNAADSIADSDKDWSCPFTITGFATDIDGQAYGVDALQAVQLVSSAIRQALEKTNETLYWHENAFWQAGFPYLIESFGDANIESEILLEMHQRLTKNNPLNVSLNKPSK